MLKTLFLVSLTVSAAIVLFLLLRGAVRRRFGAARMYLVWLILAVRLLIPLRFEWQHAPVQIPAAVTEQVDAVLSYRPAAPATEKQNAVSVAAVVTAAWGLGAVTVFGYHLCAYALFRRRIAPYLTLLQPATRKGIFVLDPPVYRCSAVEGPVMLGWLRPMILLPHTDYTAQEQAAVLLHERCHFRRGDMWWKLLLLGAKSVHWFNPLVHIMVKKAEEDLEFACDEQVIGRQNREFRKTYSRAIVKTAGEDS